MPQITQKIPNCAAKILVELDLNSIVNVMNCANRLYRSKDSEVKRDEKKKAFVKSVLRNVQPSWRRYQLAKVYLLAKTFRRSRSCLSLQQDGVFCVDDLRKSKYPCINLC